MNRLTQGLGGPVRQIPRPRPDANPTIIIPPQPAAPAWALELARGRCVTESKDLELRSSRDFTLLTMRVPRADRADGPALEAMTESAYQNLLTALAAGPHLHPLRVWNFVPGILDDGSEGLNRYMRFNAGRHRAYAELLGGHHTFDYSLPAASAVGHDGSDIVIHALASSAPGTPVANPRQCPPHRYSRKYGPLPPCFARATRVRIGTDSPLLLIGGTASIRGEQSLHESDLDNQLAETRTNLIALLGAATGQPPLPQLLDRLDRLRVYFPNAADLPQIKSAVESWFHHPDRIDWHQADLCRDELMVEIEGRATLHVR